MVLDLRACRRDELHDCNPSDDERPSARLGRIHEHVHCKGDGWVERNWRCAVRYRQRCLARHFVASEQLRYAKPNLPRPPCTRSRCCAENASTVLGRWTAEGRHRLCRRCSS